MKTDTHQTVQALCPDLDPAVVEKHLARLDPAYLERFEPETVAQHLECLNRLSSSNPVEVMVSDLGDRQAEVVVIAFDHPFEFSLITGVLAGSGFDIRSGDVFTFARVPEPRRMGPRTHHRMRRPVRRSPHEHAVIIDSFAGVLVGEQDYDVWAEQFRNTITEVLTLINQGSDASVEQAKQLVNERVTEQLERLHVEAPQQMLPVRLDIEPSQEDMTRVTIVAQDTPAFLYSLTTALSFSGLSIQRVRIESKNDRVVDELFVVDRKGQAIEDPQLIEHIKLTVLLTKQFTYFLPQAPDPYAALTRFEKIVEEMMSSPDHSQWFTQLSNPRAMQGLAKLLGTSDFLWEDFIRGQYESLMPIIGPEVMDRPLCEPAETIPLRLEQALEGAVGLAEQKDRLNRFKDRELFNIDLDHILHRGSDFQDLSHRLTLLAENLVTTAARLVYEDLVYSYGPPRDERGQPARFAVFGLGKLGGVALGYASDIELLFVYDAMGQTKGAKRKAISNSEFFEQLVRETSQVIRTKREGIFQVDLRLRPYGNDGPLACSLDAFKSYYGPGGSAHAFERLALVRLRWIAGAAKLGFDVERLRDQFVYDGPPMDLDALWEIWERVHAEKAPPGRLNAKYSPGALVDLEGTVQLLQVQNAASAPQLRTPRLYEALEGLRRAGVIDARDFATLVGGYHFYRRLINCLRMLRGNAQDLFLPPVNTAECSHLARRMDYESRGGVRRAEQLMDDFERHTGEVRDFIRRHFHRPCPGMK